MAADKDAGENKVQLSIMLDAEVLRRLDQKVKQLDRSRSWLINEMLKTPLGMF